MWKPLRALTKRWFGKPEEPVKPKPVKRERKPKIDPLDLRHADNADAAFLDKRQ